MDAWSPWKGWACVAYAGTLAGARGWQGSHLPSLPRAGLQSASWSWAGLAVLVSSHRQAHGMQNQHRVPLDSWLSWLLGHRHPARSSDIWHGRLRMLPATERKAFTTRWPSSVKACGEQQRTGLLSKNGLSEAQGVAQDARSAHARSATASGQRPRTACVWQRRRLAPGAQRGRVRGEGGGAALGRHR